MKKILLHIVSVSMVIALTFSTIGVNIISTFCGGCDEDHTSIAYVEIDSVNCDCCSSEITHCCATTSDASNIEHQSKSSFLKLNVLATTISQKAFVVSKVIVVLFLVNQFTNETEVGFTPKSIYKIYLPENLGRHKLQLNCVMLN